MGTLALEVLFLPLALVSRLRPWLWSAMVTLHISLVLVLDFADLSLGMLLIHAFTFDPTWIAPSRAEGLERLYYDGHCGLCQRSVRFLLAEGAHTTLRFAPLQGETSAQNLPADVRASLPDSLIVHTDSGLLLTRTAAVLHLCERLGGIWRLAGAALRLVPQPMRDAGYDFVAKIRRRLFEEPSEACPLVGPELRLRFDD